MSNHLIEEPLAWNNISSNQFYRLIFEMLHRHLNRFDHVTLESPHHTFSPSKQSFNPSNHLTATPSNQPFRYISSHRIDLTVQSIRPEPPPVLASLFSLLFSSFSFLFLFFFFWFDSISESLSGFQISIRREFNIFQIVSMKFRTVFFSVFCMLLIKTNRTVFIRRHPWPYHLSLSFILLIVHTPPSNRIDQSALSISLPLSHRVFKSVCHCPFDLTLTYFESLSSSCCLVILFSLLLFFSLFSFFYLFCFDSAFLFSIRIFILLAIAGLVIIALYLKKKKTNLK